MCIVATRRSFAPRSRRRSISASPASCSPLSRIHAPSSPGRPLFRLTPAPLKAALAAALGFDGTLVFPFDRALADRVRRIRRRRWSERLVIRAAVTGYDFHFGKARRGTPKFLADQGVCNGFSVTIVEALARVARWCPRPASATALARATCGREPPARLAFAVAGTVVHGDERGRELGHPTANMMLDPASELAHGIYAVRFLGADATLRDGVASYGRRPTFGGGEPVLETFVFDFSGDLYGETALVSFQGFIRHERHFDSVADLVARMDQDLIHARAILERILPGALDQRLHKTWATAG